MSAENPNVLNFSITEMVNPDTGKPFGEQYAGNFTARRPTLKDLQDVAILDAARTNAYGQISSEALTVEMANLSYIFASFDVYVTQRPDWFQQDSLYEEDMRAVTTAWKRVREWRATFRPKVGSAGGDGKPNIS
jgi:hypothetical protein